MNENDKAMYIIQTYTKVPRSVYTTNKYRVTCAYSMCEQKATSKLSK